MPLLIRQEPDPVLREIAKPVPVVDLSSSWVKKLIVDMSAALAVCVDGVALAAPQIGESWRIFIVGERAFPTDNKSRIWPGDLVFINPAIIRRSRKQVEVVEGCLSVRNQYGTIKRHERVSVIAYDLAGRKFARHASGLLAQVFQHEIEHLDGVLFIDRAWDLHEVKPNQDHV